MTTLQHVNLFLHLLSAVTWIGGSIFLMMVGPLLRELEPSASSPFMRAMARRFKIASWHAAILLIVTGIGNLYFDKAFDDFGAYMRAHPAMHMKLTLVVLMILIKYFHDFVTGPRAVKEMEALGNPAEKPRIWHITMSLARLNLILGIAVLYVAVLLRT